MRTDRRNGRCRSFPLTRRYGDGGLGVSGEGVCFVLGHWFGRVPVRELAARDRTVKAVQVLDDGRSQVRPYSRRRFREDLAQSEEVV